MTAYGGPQDTAGITTVYGYDENGDRASMTEPGGANTQYAVDERRRQTLITYDDHTTRGFGYDPVGHRTSETDQLSRTTSFKYDCEGRLAEVDDPENGTAHPTGYGYDEVGNRISQTDANGHQTKMAYDEMGREITRTYPNGDSESRTYWPTGNLMTRTDGLHRTTSYLYDVSNRLTERDYPDSSKVSFTYYPAGQRETAADTRGTTTYHYDDRSRLREVDQPDGRKLTYNLDDASRRLGITALIAAATLTTGFQYDDANRLRYVTDSNNQTYEQHYDPTRADRDWLSYPNGTKNHYTPDTQHRLLHLWTEDGGGSKLQEYTYALALNGRRDAVDELGSVHRGYAYDNLDRLKGESVTANSALVYGKSFDYDYAGNRKTQVHTDDEGVSTSTAYGYDLRDRLQTAGAVNYTWDANGNEKARDGVTGLTNTWDFDNRLLSVATADGTRVEYTYDVDGNRVRTRTTPPTGPPVTVDYLVDASMELSQVIADSVSGQWSAYYVRTPELLAVLRPNQARYVHADGLGSIRVLTDETGAVSDQYTYTAFGELLSHVGTETQPYQFAGEPRDAATGLAYHRARWMDSGVGRFVAVDLAQPHPRSPKSLHRYSYAGQSPVNFTDPSGNDFDLASVDVAETIIATEETGVGSLVAGAEAAEGAFEVAEAGATLLEDVTLAEAEGSSAFAVEGGTEVYVSYNGAEGIQYVGITDDLERRAAEHMIEKGISIIRYLNYAVSRADARAVEQTIIELEGGPGGTLLNRIASIAESNPKYYEAIQRGIEILADNGLFP